LFTHLGRITTELSRLPRTNVLQRIEIYNCCNKWWKIKRAAFDVGLINNYSISNRHIMISACPHLTPLITMLKTSLSCKSNVIGNSSDCSNILLSLPCSNNRQLGACHLAQLLSIELKQPPFRHHHHHRCHHGANCR